MKLVPLEDPTYIIRDCCINVKHDLLTSLNGSGMIPT